MKFPYRLGREFRLLLVMCALVTACAWGSTRLSTDAGDVSCIWVSTSVITAFVLTVPRRWKIAFFAVGIFACMGIDLALGDSFSADCWYGFCSCVEILITVLPIRHLAARSDVTNLRGLCRIIYFGVFLGPLAAALLGAPAVSLLSGRPYPEVLRLWFLSESLGAVAGLLTMLFLLTREKAGARKLRARWGEILIWFSPLLAITAAVFWQTLYPLVFLVFPPLIALIVRFKLTGAVFGSAFVVFLAGALTAEGHGPFKLIPGEALTEQVMLFHIFGLTLYATCLCVGFSIQERARFEGELKNANGKLKVLAFLDPLTGIRNRRGFDEIMEAAWSNALVTDDDLSLIYIDLDFFKRFNDTYGHQRGDDCLRSVAGALLRSVRGSCDCVARYGGEEFVIFLPATSADSARMTADRVSVAILELNIAHRDSPFGVVTASVGVATARPGDGGNPSDLLHLADQALYGAKEKGRNRISTRGRIGDRELILR